LKRRENLVPNIIVMIRTGCATIDPLQKFPHLNGDRKIGANETVLVKHFRQTVNRE
jgi:hypothetical protein